MSLNAKTILKQQQEISETCMMDGNSVDTVTVTTPTATATATVSMSDFDFTKTGAKPKIHATVNMDIDQYDDEIVECPLCCKQIIKTKLEKHFQIDHQEYECAFCGLQFDSEGILQSHIDEYHFEEYNDDIKSNARQQPPGQQQQQQHESRKRAYQDDDELTYKQQKPVQQEQTSFTCPICGREINDQTWLELHVDTHFNQNNANTNWLDLPNDNDSMAAGGQSIVSNSDTLKRTDSTISLIANIDDTFDIDQVITLTECELGNSSESDSRSNDSEREKACHRNSSDGQTYRMADDDDIFIENVISPFKNSQLKMEQLQEDHLTAQLLERQELERFKYDEMMKGAVAVEEDELKHEFGLSDIDRETRAKINLSSALKRKHITDDTYKKLKSQVSNGQMNSIYESTGTVTNDLIACIRQAPLPSAIVKRFVCTNCDHYATSLIDYGYGCGYRNTQMLLSSMRKDTRICDALFNNNNQNMPSIHKLQKLIEHAWSLGFDKMGSEQLGRRLENTTKWIGASDVATLFLSLKVKVTLVDINGPKENQTPSEILFDYVKAYFDTKSSTDQYIHPIYLQHQGHSRTIVGIEVGPKQTNLLLFDPSTRKKRLDEFKRNRKQMNLFRCGINSFKHTQYQLLVIDGALCTAQDEYENLKILKSLKLS